MEFKNGLNFDADQRGSGIKIIGVGDFKDAFSIEYDQLELVSVPESIDESYFLKNGDLLFVRSNGNKALIGRVLLIRGLRERVSHSGFTIRARAICNSIKPEFVASVFSSSAVKSQLHRLGGGTNISNLSQGVLGKIALPVPPLNEQVAICEVLAIARTAQEKAARLFKSRRKLKHGLLQQLLTGQRRFPEFRKQPWGDVPIGDLLREEERYVNWSDDEEYRLVSVRRRSGGFFGRERKRGRDILTKTLKVTHTGDFVLARMQVLHGAMTVTPPDFDGAHVSDSYMTFVPKDSTRLHMPYFGYLSSTRLMYHKALISSVGVAIEKMSFNPRWWLAERVHIPASLDEQKKIAGVLQACDRELELLRNLLDALKEQKKGLMQKLLTGQVRVPESMLKGEKPPVKIQESKAIAREA
jgi:type I restriction enzyme S subunit